MSSDDDPTPPHGRKPPRGRMRSQAEQDALDADSFRERQERDRRARDRLRDQVDELAEVADSVPREIEADENTAPVDFALSQEGEFFQGRLNRVKELITRNREDTADKILKALGARPPNERITALETRLKILWGVLAVIGSVVLGAALTIAKVVYEKGEANGALQMRVENIEKTVERLDRALGRPGFFLQIPKGPTP